MENLPADYWVTSAQFTPQTYQTGYPAIDPTKPSNSLNGKIAIIVGASRDLGSQGIAPAFAKAGTKGLVLVTTAADKLLKVEEEVHRINPSVQTLAVAADMSTEQSVERLFGRVKDVFGHADVLIINAGVNMDKPVIHESTVDDFWKNYEVNTKGSFILAKHFIKQLPQGSPATVLNLTTAGA